MAFSSYDNMVAYLLSEMDKGQGMLGNHFLWDLSGCAWLQKSLQVDGNYVPNDMLLCRDAWGGQKARIFSPFFICIIVHFLCEINKDRLLLCRINWNCVYIGSHFLFHYVCLCVGRNSDFKSAATVFCLGFCFFKAQQSLWWVKW